MGISHEYHSAHGRARRSRAGTGLRLAGVIAAILLLSLAVTAILENGSKESEQPQTATSSGMAENILAPLPMQGAAAGSTAGESGETAADSGSAGSTAPRPAAARSIAADTVGRRRRHPDQANEDARRLQASAIGRSGVAPRLTCNALDGVSADRQSQEPLRNTDDQPWFLALAWNRLGTRLRAASLAGSRTTALTWGEPVGDLEITSLDSHAGRLREKVATATRRVLLPGAAGWTARDTQTARRLRPLARRERITARPPRDFWRTRKPCVRLRRRTEGW